MGDRCGPFAPTLQYLRGTCEDSLWWWILKTAKVSGFVLILYLCLDR